MLAPHTAAMSVARRAVLVLCVLVVSAKHAAAVTQTSDITALETMYNSLNGAFWGVESGWDFATEDPCEDNWPGLSCSAGGTKNILGLVLTGYNITGDVNDLLTMAGAIPTLSDLSVLDGTLNGSMTVNTVGSTQLVTLRITGQEIGGPVPGFLSTYTALQTLDLSANRFTSVSDVTWSGLTSCTSLSFHTNNGPDLGDVGVFASMPVLETLNVRGSVFSSGLATLATSTSIRTLDIGSNKFASSSFSHLTSMATLVSLTASRSAFNGSLPSTMDSMTDLEYLDLDLNDFTELDDSLFDMPSIRTLILSRGVGWTTPLPANIGNAAGTLEHLDVSRGQLAGELPAGIASLSALKTLRLQDNRLSGSIPAGLWALPALEELHLGNNDFEGALPINHLAVTASSLRILRLDDNEFTGSIGSLLGTATLPQLETLSVARNNLNGTLPDNLSALTSLKRLGVEYNRDLGGTLPASWSSLTSLQQLTAQTCALGGEIPSSWASMNLTTMALASNQLTGKPPAWIEQRSWVYINLALNPFECALSASPVLDLAGATCVCPPGLVSNENSEACELCEKDRYSPEESISGFAFCRKCPPDEVQTDDGTACYRPIVTSQGQALLFIVTVVIVGMVAANVVVARKVAARRAEYRDSRAGAMQAYYASMESTGEKTEPLSEEELLVRYNTALNKMKPEEREKVTYSVEDYLSNDPKKKREGDAAKPAVALVSPATAGKGSKRIPPDARKKVAIRSSVKEIGKDKPEATPAPTKPALKPTSSSEAADAGKAASSGGDNDKAKRKSSKSKSSSSGGDETRRRKRSSGHSGGKRRSSTGKNSGGKRSGGKRSSKQP